MIEHAAHRAMHLRHAAQAIRILHPRIVQPMRLADLALLHQRPQMRRRGDLPRMRPRLMDARIERRRGAPQSFQRHSPRQIEEPHHALRSKKAQPANRSHRLRAVQQRQPFLRLQLQWRKSRSRERLGAGSRLPSTKTSPSPISASARCASGARSPLAPTEPRDGTTG